MKKGVFTVRIDPEKQEQLDALAKQLDRSRNYVVNQAIEDFLDACAWQAQQIEKGLSEAGRGEFVSDEEMERIFDRYKPAVPADQ
jgi:predicted transcriptional regulator